MQRRKCRLPDGSDSRRVANKANKLPAVTESETQQIAIGFSEFFESILKPLMETGSPTERRKPFCLFTLV